MTFQSWEGDVDAARWTALFDALRDTLREQAALPRGVPSPERERLLRINQDRIDADIAWARELSFDATMSDGEFWARIATKPFYTGKRAGSIRDKVDRAGVHMTDYNAMAGSAWLEGGQDRAAYDADASAYHNPKDFRRILAGARNIARKQVNLSGRSLVDMFVPPRDRDLSAESVRRIHANLNGETGFGFVTTLHAMTDLGIPVVKTDRVLTRLVIRLGLVEYRPTRDGEQRLPRNMTADAALKLGLDEAFSFRVQAKLKAASDASGLSMRAIDWLLVKMGMERDPGAGFLNTICGDMPQCAICKAQPLCRLGSASLKPTK